MNSSKVSPLAVGGVALVSASTVQAPVSARKWVGICPLSWILPGTGVAALVDGEQVAVFHLSSGRLYALGNTDPACGANVLARGIVGDHGAVPVIISPMHKHAYDLATGACAADPALRVPVYAVRVSDGIVQVGPRLVSEVAS